MSGALFICCGSPFQSPEPSAQYWGFEAGQPRLSRPHTAAKGLMEKRRRQCFAEPGSSPRRKPATWCVRNQRGDRDPRRGSGGQLILGERQGFPPAGGHLLSTPRTAMMGEEPPRDCMQTLHCPWEQAVGYRGYPCRLWGHREGGSNAGSALPLNTQPSLP